MLPPRVISFVFYCLLSLSPFITYVITYIVDLPWLQPVESFFWLGGISTVKAVLLIYHWRYGPAIFSGVCLAIDMITVSTCVVGILFPLALRSDVLVVRYLALGSTYILPFLARQNLLDYREGCISTVTSGMLSLVCSFWICFLAVYFSDRLYCEELRYALTTLSFMELAAIKIYLENPLLRLLPSPVDLTKGRSFFRFRPYGVIYYSDLASQFNTEFCYSMMYSLEKDGERYSDTLRCKCHVLIEPIPQYTQVQIGSTTSEINGLQIFFWLGGISAVKAVLLIYHWKHGPAIFTGVCHAVNIMTVAICVLVLFPVSIHCNVHVIKLLAISSVYLLPVLVRQNLLDYLEGGISIVTSGIVSLVIHFWLSFLAVYMSNVTYFEDMSPFDDISTFEDISPYALTVLSLFEFIGLYSYLDLYLVRVLPASTDLTNGRSFFQFRPYGILYYLDLASHIEMEPSYAMLYSMEKDGERYSDKIQCNSGDKPLTSDTSSQFKWDIQLLE